jgi:hypothetical protein
MLGFLRLWFGLLVRCFRSHRSLLVENLALRQQLIVLKRRLCFAKILSGLEINNLKPSCHHSIPHNPNQNRAVRR